MDFILGVHKLRIIYYYLITWLTINIEPKMLKDVKRLIQLIVSSLVFKYVSDSI